jgi:hypothetical protein
LTKNILQLCRPRGFQFGAMKNQPSDSSEPLWRKPLPAAERAALRAQPELELEARLTSALANISDAPVPSNFTARVLAAVDLEEKIAARPARGWNWRLFLPRFAVATAVLIFAGVSIQRYEASAHRLAITKSVAMIASTPAQPSVDALENLDAIQRMSQSARADGDLLAALQ